MSTERRAMPDVIGRYHVRERLGAGGMGEVFRAHDPVLARDVAIKIVAARYRSDATAGPRFERERRLAAALEHPHICRLLDAGHAADLDFVVMEYLQGETLDRRLGRGPIPMSDALAWGRQIAAALQYAHSRGVIHLDLKPANVLVTRQGIKLLDFGLAQLLGGGTTAEAAPETLPLAVGGTVLGTAPYLAPERLEGADADARTDIYGLGLLLYEMITGRRMFAGESGPALFARITAGPVLHPSLRERGGAELEWIVSRCVARNPEARWQSSGDIEAMLEHFRTAPAVSQPSRRPGPAAWGVALIALLTAASFGAYSLRDRLASAPPEMRRVFSAVQPPPGAVFHPTDGSVATPQFALAPDGSSIVFVAREADAKSPRRLWVRRLDASAADPLEGTEGARYPFWSPDSRAIGFFADNHLKRIDLDTGGVIDLAEAAQGRGGTWNRHGLIVFAGDNTGGLYSVPARGGDALPLTQLDASRQETSHRWPHFLADGQTLIYFARSALQPGPEGIFRLRLGNATPDAPAAGSEGPVRLLASSHSGTPAGDWLLHVSGSMLLARRLDGGDSDALVARDIGASSNFYVPVSASRSGVLAYAKAADRARLEWRDAEGRFPRTVTMGRITDFALSPDARQLAIAEVNDETGVGDIFRLDLETRTRQQVTATAGANRASATWVGDSQLAFRSNPQQVHDIYITGLGGRDRPRLLVKTPVAKYPTSASRDGRLLLFQVNKGAADADIWARALPDGEPYPVVNTAADEIQGQLSPDGRHVAYTVMRGDVGEVYVRPLVGTGTALQVSDAGGSHPRWSPDGRTLYYLDPQGVLLQVTPPLDGRRAQAPKPVMTLTPAENPINTAYDVASDGRFLVRVPLDTDVLNVFTGWFPPAGVN